MTCQRVAWVHPTCTCGALLQLGVDHGDDELGNPLCPTCSGCGCEPNERKNMTPEELDALPDDAIVLIEGDPLVKCDGRWRYLNPAHASSASDELDGYATYVLLHPVPEPDHSMCARLVPQDDREYPWMLRHPDGAVVGEWTATGATGHGYAIPEPEPTVVERAAKVLGETLGHGDEPELARALDRAGLLVRDGEQ